MIFNAPHTTNTCGKDLRLLDDQNLDMDKICCYGFYSCLASDTY